MFKDEESQCSIWDVASNDIHHQNQHLNLAFETHIRIKVSERSILRVIVSSISNIASRWNVEKW